MFAHLLEISSTTEAVSLKRLFSELLVTWQYKNSVFLCLWNAYSPKNVAQELHSMKHRSAMLLSTTLHSIHLRCHVQCNHSRAAYADRALVKTLCKILI